MSSMLKFNESKNCLKLQKTNSKSIINVKNLQKELRELQEENEKLRKIHNSDQEKLKDYELLKSNYNELLEFKLNFMENYEILQRDLQKAQHDLIDLENLRENHKKEMELLTNELEIVIIDKEIAEKQSDLIQDYLDESREEVKQLHIELSILREKINDNNNNAVFIPNNDYQRKNLEDECKRLREALDKIREVLIDEKRNHQKSVKNLEINKSKINELNIINENLNKRINEQDDQIKDLKEQIDATLGSEELIVLLADQKLSLEEYVIQLENDFTDLQDLKEILNQINEENHEVIKNLHKEIETYELNTFELKKNNNSLNEIIKDRELTIVKYRDLVQKLQSKLNYADKILNEQQEQIRNDSLMIDNIEFQKIFNKSKEFEQNIDVELRKIHVEELLQHIQYLMLFIPNSFNNHNDILTLLLISRCDQKLNILSSQIRGKFHNVQKWDRNLVFTDHYFKQFTFCTRLLTYINVIQCLLHQYIFMLNTCSVDSFNKVSEIYREIEQQEQLFNHLLDLLKKDQLDENYNFDLLEQSTMYFYVMLPIFMKSESVWNQSDLLKDFLNLLNLSCKEFEAYIDLLKYLKISDDKNNNYEIDQLLELCSNCLQKWYQQNKQIKYTLSTRDFQGPNLGFQQQDFFESVFSCYFHSLKLSKVLLEIIEGVLNCDGDTKVENDKLMELAISSSTKVYKQDDLGQLVNVKESLEFITNRLDSFLEYFENNTIISNNIDEKSPIFIKAENFKNEFDQIGQLREMIENKDINIQLLHTKLRNFQESFSEIKLRKDIAEKKLSNAESYKDKTFVLLLEKNNLQIQLDTKCKEHENIYNNLRSEIESLKKEHEEYSITNSEHSMDISSSTSIDTILEEVRNLKQSLREIQSEKTEITEITSNNLIEQTDSLGLINYQTMNNLQNDNLLMLNRKLNNIYNETLSIFTQYKMIDWNDPIESLRKFKEDSQKDQRYIELDKRFNQIKHEIGKELIRYQKGAKINKDFKDFPTIDLVELLNEGN